MRLHLRSDVPVGGALSGGLDSSAIAALVQRERTAADPFYAFTAAFPGAACDETPFAQRVTSTVQAQAHLVTPSAEKFLAELDDFIWHHDEPVGSLSMYAAWCVARRSREEGIKVLLNGQGGDEIMAGYWQQYFLYLRELASGAHLLRIALHVVGSALPGGNFELVRQAPAMWRRYRERRRASAGQGASVLGKVLGASGVARRQLELRSLFLPRLLKWDDRSSMAFGVEGRYPFLDHELIETCLSFEPEVLYHRGWTKCPMRRGLAEVLPGDILWRRSKLGFEVPQSRWLAGPLKPTLEAWLAADRPLWSLVPRERVAGYARKAYLAYGFDDEAGQALFRHFVFDRWLDVMKVR